MCEDIFPHHGAINEHVMLFSKPALLLRLKYLSRVDFSLQKCMLTFLSLSSLETFIISTQPFRRVVEQVSGCFCLLELSHRKSSRCCFPSLIHQETLEKLSRGAVKAGRGAEEHEGNTVSASWLASVCRLVLCPQKGGRKQLTGVLQRCSTDYDHTCRCCCWEMAALKTAFFCNKTLLNASEQRLPPIFPPPAAPAPPSSTSLPRRTQSDTAWEQQSGSHTSGADEAAHTRYWALWSGGVPQGTAGGCSSLFVPLLQ